MSLSWFFTTLGLSSADSAKGDSNDENFEKLCKKAEKKFERILDVDEEQANEDVRDLVLLLYDSANEDFDNALKIDDKVTELTIRIDQLSEESISKIRKIGMEVKRMKRNEISVIPAANGVGELDTSKLLVNVDNKELGKEIVVTIRSCTDTHLSDVEGIDAAKSALHKGIVLPSLDPKLFSGLGAPPKGILLFGPAGNGKTMLVRAIVNEWAKAVTNECKYTFFNIWAPKMMTKLVRDGDEVAFVRALFQVAKNAQPCIIFIDKADSMFSDRVAEKVRTEFLAQMADLGNWPDVRVQVLAATNRPNELDERILGCFTQKLFIDCPEQKSKAKIIERTFGKNNTRHALTEQDLESIETETDSFSFFDMMVLCQVSAFLSKDSLQEQVREVTKDDVVKALEGITATTDAEERKKYVEFVRENGIV